MTLQPQTEHPHGLSDADFDTLFTTDKPVIFAYHGYPWLIHRLTYRRTNHHNIHVRGYKEEGTTTTPFDMVVMNDLDRFHLAGDVIDRVPSLGYRAAYLKQHLRDKLLEHKAYTRLITCHLGSGASVCALRDGKSVDTSMGLTPLEGLAMGTRSGDVDPGLLLYLLRTQNMTPEQLNDVLNHQSGLLGLSGRSGDVRELEQAAQSGDARAKLALDIFAYRAYKYIGAYAAVLDGLDALAFTGGIGEHSPPMRERICRTLGFLGVRLSPSRNKQAGSVASRISADEAATPVWVIPADEERQIAREVFALLAAPRDLPT